MRVLPFLSYLLLLSLHCVITADLTSIYTASIDLAALLTLIVALYKGEFTALWFGFVAGLFGAAAGPAYTLGWQALVLAGIGLVGYHVRGRLNLDSLLARLGFIGGGVLLHCIASILIDGGYDFFYQLGVRAIPSMIYTVIVAWLFFLFKEKRITFQKIKALY
ncbi:MAG TPA: hypothetical protein PLF13_11345 [candidate division Zixibacteria bacterium]|nr:hypothetical protein [candidate division Zixibacteria bacterium]